MFDILFKNAHIVCSDGLFFGHIAVKNGKIASITNRDNINAEKIIDVQNNYILPGAIDCHVHFNEPGYTWREDFQHGTKAAAAGGITTVIDMPMQNTPAVADAVLVERKDRLLHGKAYVDYAYWGALIHDNLDKLGELAKTGVAAFKCFMCTPSPDYTKLDLTEIEKVLVTLKTYKAVAGFHCEDDKIIAEQSDEFIRNEAFSRENHIKARPLAAELKAISDIINLAEKTGGKVHICHVSHPEAAALIKQARQKGVQITAETCMHYLVFSNEDLLTEGAVFKCAPPLREKESPGQLWEYVQDGTIDCICSDHSPCAITEKAEDGEQGIFSAWGGISGVQTSLQLLWDMAVNKYKQSPLLVARLMAENPAAIFGLNHCKGILREGMDADMVIIDPEKKWTIKDEELYYKNKFSAFSGLSGQGCAVLTMVRGNVVYENGVFGKRTGERICRRNY